MAKPLLIQHLTILVLSVLCLAEIEPKCSKFDFEEKLLEKLVRMEHQNEIMMDDFRKISLQVKDDLETMKQESDKVSKLVEEFLQRPSYAFHANWLANANPENGETLVFSRIKLNEGKVYSKNTGQYTAPVNGTYHFTTTLCVGMAKWAHIQFMAGSTQVGAFLAGNTKAYLCSSSAVTVLLHTGVEFSLKMVSKSSETPFYNADDYYLSNFSGHLINEV